MSYLGRLNSVLRSNHLRTSAKERNGLSARLPDWVEKGTSLVYVSRSNNSHHTVKVKAIEERKQAVVIVFESDKRIWKRIPFSQISTFGESLLQPLWKKMDAPTVPNRPKGFVDEVVEAEPGPTMGPEPAPSTQAGAAQAAASGEDEDEVKKVAGQGEEQSNTCSAEATGVAQIATAPEPSEGTNASGVVADSAEDVAAPAVQEATGVKKKKKRKKADEEHAEDRKEAKAQRAKDREARRAASS